VAFTCPRCQRASPGPEDERQGYCGACHDWTGPGVLSMRAGHIMLADSCGRQQYIGYTDSGLEVRPLPDRGVTIEEAARRYVREAYGTVSLPSPASFITSSHTDSESPSSGGTDWPGPYDVPPYGDAMEWQPGDAEW
jgi:hypothetical protein